MAYALHELNAQLYTNPKDLWIIYGLITGKIRACTFTTPYSLNENAIEISFLITCIFGLMWYFVFSLRCRKVIMYIKR